MFSAYFVFQCLNMFCFEKQVSEFLATHFGYLRELPASCQFWLLGLAACKPRVQTERFRGSLATCLATHQSRNTQNQLFKEFFLWETCFKPLPSSLKLLFQYFYIKTQSIWMVFHSINISKVILNSFLWFWSLDYVLESFCALRWDFHHKG